MKYQDDCVHNNNLVVFSLCSSYPSPTPPSHLLLLHLSLFIYLSIAVYLYSVCTQSIRISASVR